MMSKCSAFFRTAVVWCCLCGLTAVSVVARRMAEAPADGAIEVGLGVLGLGFVKAFMVGWYFMELENAPRRWQLLFLGWGVCVLGLFVYMFLQTLAGVPGDNIGWRGP